MDDPRALAFKKKVVNQKSELFSLIKLHGSLFRKHNRTGHVKRPGNSEEFLDNGLGTSQLYATGKQSNVSA